MKGRQWDALCDAIQRSLARCEQVGLNQAQTANEVAHAAVDYLERLPYAQRPVCLDPTDPTTQETGDTHANTTRT